MFDSSDFQPISSPTKAPASGSFDNSDFQPVTDLQSMATQVPSSDSMVKRFFSPIKSGIQNVGNIATGAYKGAASTVSNISSLGQTALDQTAGRVANVVTGKGFTPTNSPTMNQSFEGTNAITPQGTAQNIGYGAEKVGEFFVPGGAEEQAGKAAGTALEHAPQIIKTAGELGTKALTSAGTMAGVTTAQGGTPQDIEESALLGGVASPLAAGASKLLEKVPESAWSKILNRASTQIAKNPNLSKQAAETGMTGLSREALSAKAGQSIQDIEVKLDDLLKSSTGSISPLKIAPYLDKLREAYSQIPGEENSLEAINKVAKDFLSKKSLTPSEANEMKRAIYQNISNSYGKGLLDIPAKTDAQKAIALGLKDEINRIIPGAKDLNSQQAIYIQMQKALDKAAIKNSGKAVIGFKDLGLEGLGLGLGHPVAGLGAVVIKKAAESPAVLSNVSKLANYFNDLSPTKKLLFYNGIKGLTAQTIPLQKGNK